MANANANAVNIASMEPITSSPRISFSADFLDDDDDDKDFISISPGDSEIVDKAKEFEFLSGKFGGESKMTAADELFFEGKLLPFWQMHHGEKLNKISLKTEEEAEQGKEESRAAAAVSWFLDDDPSPRPPKCTVLWKELLRLRKQRASSLSPSSSTSSSSSSSSGSLSDAAAAAERQPGNRDKNGKMKVKKGLERTRSATIRVRPVINVPICTQGKTSALPPIFSLRKGKLER